MIRKTEVPYLGLRARLNSAMTQSVDIHWPKFLYFSGH